MSDWLPPTSEAIQHEAYLLWEADGRPFGRDYEYWMRASGVLTERAQHAAAEAERQAEAARQAALEELAVLGWPRGAAEKPMKLRSVRRPKRLPQMRGPATRPVRIEGKTA
jgi:hypothetical protein